MKLNSRKKNTLGRFWMSIFFILAFYLVHIFFGDKIVLSILSIKDNLNLYIISKEDLLNENKKLKIDNNVFINKNVFANYYYDRTQELEQKLKYYNVHNSERENYKVSYLRDDVIYDSLVAYSKKDSYVKVGSKVYLKDNFLLGKVSLVEGKILKIRLFSDFGYKNYFSIIQNGQVLYKGEGVGDSSGLIKVLLPRDVKASQDSVLVLDDVSQGVVGVFLKDIFKSQDTNREVYFKVVQNPYTLTEVEIEKYIPIPVSIEEILIENEDDKKEEESNLDIIN